MKEYGRQRSVIKPQEIEITETKVFLYSNVKLIEEQGAEDQPGFTGYEFDLVEYEKDEYIELQAEKNKALETQMTDTQIALCEVYEMML